jgi:hypothetical protein
MSCYGLLSATRHPSYPPFRLPHLPPSPHCVSVAPPAAMLSGLEGRRAPCGGSELMFLLGLYDL